MKPRHKCDRLGCTAMGVWYPVFLVYAAAMPVSLQKPHRLVVNLTHCRAHRDEIRDAEQLMTDEGWAKLAGALVAVGAPAPSRKLTALDWTRFDSDEVLRLELARATPDDGGRA